MGGLSIWHWLIVLLIVLLVGIFLWLLDMFLQWGFGAITGVGG